jgi:hypothetical protein
MEVFVLETFAYSTCVSRWSLRGRGRERAEMMFSNYTLIDLAQLAGQLLNMELNLLMSRGQNG